ncbi:MAG: type II secretion system F family protein [Lentisphaeraceae bacterium]|nr:type II secretion system F family protein [Lentisphaeraceae bacterium]
MPLYRFKAADASGAVIETVIEGESQNDAIRRLKMRRMTPVDFLGEGEGSSKKKGIISRSKFNATEFTDRLVPLLEAGIPLERSLAIIEETMEVPADADFIRDMRQGLHEGRKFSQLVRDRNNMFPRIYGNIVEVGEESGALPLVLKQMQTYLNERKELRSYVVSASIYPLVIGLVSSTVVLFLLGFIVPKFAKIIEQSKRTPSTMTQILLDISYIVQNYWHLITLAFVGVVSLLLYLKNNEKFQEKVDETLLKVPVVKNIVVIGNVATLVKTMAVMLKSGVHLLQAVQIAARVLPNAIIRQSISSVSSRLRQGEKLSDALSQSEFLPKLVTKMLAVGEETGNVEEMMERVGTRYDSEMKAKIKGFLSLFEPLVIVTLGLVIAFIVVTMFMAISDVTKFN